MNWKKQGSAIVANFDVTDGRKATVVLVGARSNPKGAALVLSSGGADQSVTTEPIAQRLDLLTAKQVIDIVTMQERVFGNLGLPSPFTQED